MKIETDDYFSFDEAAAELGCSRRGIFRAVSRAEADDHDVTTTIFGVRLIRRAALRTLQEYYYPYGSPAHQKMVVVWGAMGGTAKQARARAAASGRRGGRA